MKILRLIVMIGLLSSIQMSAAITKTKHIKRSSTRKHQSRLRIEREQSPQRKRAKLCSPAVLRTTVTVSGFFIKAAAIIIGAVLQAVINK